MKFSSADFSTMLNRILDAAADDLRIAKILVQMGLDPSNITYDALFDRLVKIALANVTLATSECDPWNELVKLASPTTCGPYWRRHKFRSGASDKPTSAPDPRREPFGGRPVGSYCLLRLRPVN
jgi:hypothetical protein